MPSTKATILIVDDEKNALAMVSQGLKLEGYAALTASSGEEAEKVCASTSVDLVLLDIIMPDGMNGIETLAKLRQAHPDLNVVMMSAQQDIETAVKAMELGARKLPRQAQDCIRDSSCRRSFSRTIASISGK